jgi:hypothetical protein
MKGVVTICCRSIVAGLVTSRVYARRKGTVEGGTSRERGSMIKAAVRQEVRMKQSEGGWRYKGNGGQGCSKGTKVTRNSERKGAGQEREEGKREQKRRRVVENSGWREYMPEVE